MREHKYKAWHIPTKKMFDVYGFSDDYVFDDSMNGLLSTETTPAMRNDCVLLQRIGKIEGKDVYDGDIIKGFLFEYGTEANGVVRYDINSFCFILDIYGEYYHLLDIVSVKINIVNIEIIGNIYEHEHLLAK